MCYYIDLFIIISIFIYLNKNYKKEISEFFKCLFDCFDEINKLNDFDDSEDNE